MSDELNFDDLTPIEIPVSVAGKKYVMREADEETAALFNNARMRGTRLEDGKVVGLPTDMAGVQSLLVSRCLFIVDKEGVPTRQYVKRTTVNSWPARVVKPLFEKAKEISELDEDETVEMLVKQRAELTERIVKLQEEAAKNEPEDTTDNAE